MAGRKRQARFGDLSSSFSDSGFQEVSWDLGARE